MADKENDDLEQSLKNINLDDANSDLDALLADDGNGKDMPLPSVGQEDASDDDFIDFNDFSIDDLDTALKQYEADADLSVGGQQDGEPLSSTEITGKEPMQTIGQPAVASVPEETPVDDNAATPAPAVSPAASSSLAEENLPEAEPEPTEPEPLVFTEAPTWERTETNTSNAGGAPVSAKSEKKDSMEKYGLYSQEAQEKLGYLRWYDGRLGEKVYEISLTNMPEFLDYDPRIKTIHVNIDSPYGWNVFFENGTFMNLMDLKEFQERNGYLPGNNGKIIYGGKTSSFEGIERIVVYEKPRYFSYGVKK